MTALTMMAILATQTSPSGQLPLAEARPLGAYSSCLLDPLDEVAGVILPQERTEREQIVAAILKRCAGRRSTTRKEARRAASSLGARAEVDRALLAAKSQLRFFVVDRENAIAADEAFCRARGEEPGC